MADANTTKQTHSPVERLRELLRGGNLVRSADLAELGIPRVYLSRLVGTGELARCARGIYRAADGEVDENHSLASVALRVPEGVICLLSALRFHGLTTQSPFEVWLGIDRKARTPRLDFPPLHIVRFSESHRREGVNLHSIEGVPVRITNPARTVMDCFAYRNTVGIDIAIEALRDCLRLHKSSVDDLYRAAKSRQMTRVVQPYLESILS